ncbi:AAA domain-containing protein [Streptococcus agalactiae]|nr:AAA domain-containing protein [Streptococcus agalactiae]KAA8975098.1 AAA domain-containing protein [Streptococcus agalactiae]KAA9093424.1 AAA domain-containing protein [Streptococcus agalactiae]KAA9096709.1 AAA domain-containing protein [Streptococcus agalactiae]KAA9101475.1 AAA domain-containing protein [Streptococcus agalactiae]
MSVYEEMDLKLGIKSSLPHVKSTIALALLLWECAERPSELKYSVQSGDETVLAPDIEQRVKEYLSAICEEENIDLESISGVINANQLFKSQMEALIVAFELVWKIAKVNFVDDTKAASAERTGGVRFPKKLTYSINADIIHTLIESNRDSYIRILMSWVGINVGIDHNLEMNLVHLLTAMSETAIFKLVDGTRDVIFNQNSIYEKILETHDKVDLNGDKEAKGSLRILKSLLSDSMNPYLEYSNGVVKQADSDNLEDYQIRVETFLKLSATKVVGIDEIEAESTGFSSEEFEEIRLTTGCNVLLYGVPGSGKSWTIEHEYCDDEDCMERLVFHPDYMYSDFVGQILPIVKKDEEGKEKVRYEFTPGPFTKILKKAYLNPSKSYYLIIEEINRGNAPAIFGEIFQLLDRQTEDSILYKKGTSEYGITNDNIAFEVYGDTEKKVRIPANLSIIGTMNTSDQNVFTLDTAFQRRWIMRMIPNSFENHKFAEEKILDTEVSWQQFCEAINEEILRRNNVTSSEDKRLGAYFVSADDLDFKKETDHANEKEKIEVIHKNARFAEKVLKYLWDDAFKFAHADTFDTRKYKSLEMVIDAFNSTNGNDRFKVFHENLRKLIIEGVDESNIVSESEED